MKYIERSIEGIVVVDERRFEVKSSLIKYLNIECMKHGSTYGGRISSLKYLLNRKGLVPLYVNREVLLLFSINIRQWNVVLVNYHRILSIRDSGKNDTVVVFDDCSAIVLNVSFNRFVIQYRAAKQVNELLS